jgi:hypothetical protein
MSKKREERKQRSEAHRAVQEQVARQRKLKGRALFVVGVLVIIAAAFLATRSPDDGEQRAGRVWSAAHGHWHDK